MKELYLNKNVTLMSGGIHLKEQIHPETGEKAVLFELDVIPFGRVSRNGVMYNKESALETKNQIIGLPLHDNHRTEDSIRTNPPFGHFVDSYEKDGWLKALADVDPREETFIHKTQRGDISKCSLQITAGKVVEREDTKTGKQFHEAFIEDWIEISAVVAPGFKNASLTNRIEMVIAESFGKGFKARKVDDLNDKQLSEFVSTLNEKEIKEIIGEN